MKSEIAILIFTQGVSKDAAHKTLTPKINIGLNKNLFQKLNLRVKHIAYQTHLPVFHSNGLISNSGTYGKQLSLAVEKVFEKGFDKIICLGNDCPTLSKVQILEAANGLLTHDTVIGPDKHGGVYLLGISKSSFEADSFKKLAWKSDQMLNSFLEKFENLSLFSLETIADVQSFHQLKTNIQTNYFVKILLQFIQNFYSQTIYILIYSVHNQLNKYSSLRAPPVF